MVVDPFSAAVIGSVIAKRVKGAFTIFNQCQEYFSKLDIVTETLNDLAPHANQMSEYNQKLPQPSQEIERLQKLIREGEELVKSLPKTWWKLPSIPHNHRRLREMDKKIMRCTTVNLPVQNSEYLMKVMVDVEKILKFLMEDFGQYYGVHINGIRGPPEEPECIGMEDHLRKLKMELLKDGVSVHVLTGLGGSGKSTLAKKICWDPRVKETFRTNIFFVTFSETPNVKNIVGKLFRNCGCQVPDFENDEDAINQLGILLRPVGRNPILLVLDDVWDNSEALIEKFKIRTKHYKILVTSRFAFQRFGTPLILEPLDHEKAVLIFRHFAHLDSSSSMPSDELVEKIVRGCKGSPLALELTAGDLRNKPFSRWQIRSILEFKEVSRLQQSIDTLEEKSPYSEKKCFIDLGLFPEDQRIPVATLIDMWAELYNRDDEGRDAMNIVDALTTRNLVKLTVTRKVPEDEYMPYNNHYITLYGILRELLTHQSEQEPFEQRNKLSIELYGDNSPKSLEGQNQQSISSGHMFSFIFRRLISQNQKRVAAQVLSISTDENFVWDWHNLQPDWRNLKPDKAVVLILNLRSPKYSLPHFMDKMKKLKVLIVTNYGFHRSELSKFELLASLPDLKRIRLEQVSVPCLSILNNLQKISLHMCNTKQAFEESSIKISDVMPNLVEVSIDYCKDLEKLPDEVCEIVSLKKVSITNCHKLSALPQDIGNLKNLELLRLSSCSNLEDIPESVGELDKLGCLDISDCVSLNKLPESIRKLHNLKKLYMKGCSGLSEVPFSDKDDFEHLNHELYVICDEERAALWEHVGEIPNLKIEITKQDADLKWLDRARS